MRFEKIAATLDTLSEVTMKDPELGDLYGNMIEHAVRYARIRVDWLIGGEGAKQGMEEDRSRAHDAFISSCIALSRNMAQRGLNISWRADLGSDRQVIGDFACMIHAVLGIQAR